MKYDNVFNTFFYLNTYPPPLRGETSTGTIGGGISISGGVTIQ
jgi:hypothetical protein